MTAQAECDRLNALHRAQYVQPLVDTLLAVIGATREYLIPDGMGQEDFINLILQATDNQNISRIILELENA